MYVRTSIYAPLLCSVIAMASCDTDEGTAGHPLDHDVTRSAGGHGGTIYPDDEGWAMGTPEDHGLSSAGLAAMASVAEAYDSSCVVVIHDGVLVGEWYWDGFDRHTPVTNAFSVTKSVTSTLVGIAEAQGALDVDDSAATYIPQWQGTASEGVTVRNLISNDSGRFWSFESDYVTGLLPAFDQTAYGIGLDQQFAPGTSWEYNNAAIQTLEAVLSSATDEDVADLADELFDAIGASAHMTRDPAGNPLTYQGVVASCDDLARFGYLALREGRWKNRQVVPKQWIADATTPNAINDAYGYMWWLNQPGHVVEPSFPFRVEYDGQLVPGSPDELFIAIGAFGQLVIVDPVDEYVIVRLQDIPDLDEGLATSPDPVGMTQLRALLGAFEAARL